MGQIRRLSPGDVVKIAAGEIVVAPANALKELLENSLDAGASAIDVVAAGGGIDLLQVTDNGSGIMVDDLDILCERHTTSKIKSFEDVASVATLGFRGEALASLSHVSHLSVVTRTKDAEVATSVSYEEGIPTAKKITAGLVGTRITVENLFYNMPIRARTHQGKTRDTYAKILEVVTRYALVKPGTRFSCRQKGDTQPTVLSGKDTKSRIQQIYGNSVAQELQPLEINCEPSMGLLGAKGLVSGVNFESKRSLVSIFFVNGRLVEIPALTRAVSAALASISPSLANTGFILLELLLDPTVVDVNIHPTKQSVGLLYEEALIGAVCSAIDAKLTSAEADSRKLRTQSFITSQLTSEPANSLARPATSSQSQSQSFVAEERPQSQRRYEHKLVRTDPRQRTLAVSKGSMETPHKKVRLDEDLNETDAGNQEQFGYKVEIDPEAEHRQFNLGSITKLKSEAREAISQRLLNLFAQSTLVGCVDKARCLAAVQSDLKLYLVNYREAARVLIYQTVLSDFGNFGVVEINSDDGLDLLALAQLANANYSDEQLKTLAAMRDMLYEYFRIQLSEITDEGKILLKQVPLLIPGMLFSPGNLVDFAAALLKLDFDDELACLRGAANAIVELYDPRSVGKDVVETLFSCFKQAFAPTRDLEHTVIEIASLPGLYKVFERC